MSKGKVQFRDISPALQVIRNFLLGREHGKALRFQPLLSARTQPPPDLPDGVGHKVDVGKYIAIRSPALLTASNKKINSDTCSKFHRHAHNYYYTRDGRREAKPPLDLTQKLLTDGAEKGEPRGASVSIPKPGRVYHWDQHY